MRIDRSYEPVHSVSVQYHQYTIYKNTKKFNMWAYKNEFIILLWKPFISSERIIC